MSNLKDNKNNSINNNVDLTKKTSLPLIVGTGAMIIASVMTLEPSINLEVAKVNNLNSACYVQNNDENKKNSLSNDSEDENNLPNDEDNEFLDEYDEEDNLSKSDEFPSYVRGRNGELFYDSSAEDDKYYYGNWDRVDPNEKDDDDKFIIW
ncbi:MAG: hypothetical protein ACI4WH_02255 [Oscillospiraceae bacterium]